MKHFCLFLLALVASGGMALSHVTSGVTAPADLEIARGENMTSVESNDSNAVEVGGIRFETLVPVPLLKIPDKKPDALTRMKVGIRLTNKTLIQLNFPRYFSLHPTLLASDGQALKMDSGIGQTSVLAPTEPLCQLAKPGESLTFLQNASLYWRNSQLQFGISDGYGGTLIFYNLKPGTYRLGYRYVSGSVGACSEVTENREFRWPEGVWQGEAVIPFLEFRLVQE